MPTLDELWIALQALTEQVDELRNQPPAPPITGGGASFSDLNLAGLFYYAREQYEGLPGVGTKDGLMAIAMTASAAAAELAPPFATLAQGVAECLSYASGRTSAGGNEPAWSEFFDGMAEEAHLYQVEGDTSARRLLTLGEFYRVIAVSIQLHLRPGTGLIRSAFSPGGVQKPASLHMVLGNVQSLAYALAKWYGCWRAPKVTREAVGPVDFDNLPYSIAYPGR